MFWYNILHHLISISYALPSLCESQVLGDRLIRMVGVIQQEVSLLNILRSNYAVGILLPSKKPLITHH